MVYPKRKVILRAGNGPGKFKLQSDALLRPNTSIHSDRRTAPQPRNRPMKNLRNALIALALAVGVAACGSDITGPTTSEYTPGPGNYTPGPGNYTPGPGNYTPGPGNYTPGPGNYTPGPGN
jgi:hypothetical protein